MSCVICGGETKKTHKHKLFKTEIHRSPVWAWVGNSQRR
jgi:hypothetical protein